MTSMGLIQVPRLNRSQHQSFIFFRSGLEDQTQAFFRMLLNVYQLQFRLEEQ